MTPNTIPNIIKERKIQMSKWDKLIARICNLSRDLRFTELQKVYVVMVRKVVESEEKENENV